ncbi:MAG: RNA polymerase sigma factor FliA [Cellvibrionaceae bacterium]|nr:RNA polymerase sigma factor FliA [Cellvibrionaceae bacterium]
MAAVNDTGAKCYQQSSKVSAAPVVEEYVYLVKRIAQHVMARMPASVQLDDLVQAGMVGLLEAWQKYDAAQGASFETYAGIRIRGAIIDEMRKGDWVPRSVHRNARRISDVIAGVEAQLGRDATSTEIADAMGIDINEYHTMCQDVVYGRLFSIEESFDDDDNSATDHSSDRGFVAPHDNAQQAGLKQALAREISELPEREALILSLYYDEELNLKEIGQIIGVSESRVSQIHSQAALRLRSRLRDWL